MKKSVYSILAALAVVFALVSCAKEAQIPDDEVTPKEVVEEQEPLIEVTLIAGNPEAEPATKTEMVGTTPYWSVGDKIGVATGSNNVQYPFTTGISTPSTSASFTGSTVSGDLYAYYPYSSYGLNNSGQAKVLLPIDQYPTASSFDGSADIMVAKQFTVSPSNTTVSDLQFARLGAIVKLVLIDKNSTMVGTQSPSKVSMTAESNLAGRVYVDMTNQELGSIYYDHSTNVSANYTSSTKYAINGTNATYLIVYPQTLPEGSTLTITASTDDYNIEKTITVPAGGIELLPGKVNTLNINLLASHIVAKPVGSSLPFVDNMSWANNGGSDSNTDISGSISDPANSNGLYISAVKAYKGTGGLKLGSSGASGSITTKELDLSGDFYIAIEGGQYGTDTGTLEVEVDDDKVITGEDIDGLNYVNIAAGTYTKNSKVTISTSEKRGYIYSVKIKSGTYAPDPVISVTSSNPMGVPNTNELHAIQYTITNPSSATISASSNVVWIHDFDYSVAGEVAFEVDAQTAGDPARSGIITLSYTGAADVEVTVNQAAGSGGKTEYTATLTISSHVSEDGTLKDDKNNSWTVSAVGDYAGSETNMIHVGTNNAVATSITLSSSAFASVDIKEIHVWAAAKASTNVTTKISIGSTELGESDELSNTSGSGGTEYYVTNSSNESGTITIEVSRPSSTKGAIYFNKLTVVYEAD